jgi:hypothetical protein
LNADASGPLGATAQGEALYRKLGWRVHTPYASALIVAAEGA